MQRLNASAKIEKKSFKIIDKFLKGIQVPARVKPVVRRVIHATADTNYARGLVFHPMAVKAGINAINKGKTIVVDANMVRAGINKKLLRAFGCKLICRLDSKRVREEFLTSFATRSSLAMRSGARSMNKGIVVVGNAPTALFEVCRLIKERKAQPALVIGVPVGFVGAVQAKRQLRASGVPSISNYGRKGGSACAAAIMNALLIMALKKRGL